MRRIQAVGLVLAMAAAIAVAPRPAGAQVVQPGTLDRTYGNGGVSVLSLPTGWGFGPGASSVAQPDGKVIVAGTVHDANDVEHFGIRRYDPSGAPDTTWGTGGLVVTSFGHDEEANAVALQPDGKIVAVGGAEPFTQHTGFLFARYLPDGRLDPTFHSTGKLAWTNGLDRAFSVAIQPDGKIVAAGWSGDDNHMVVVRIKPNGAPDTTFNYSGRAVITVGGYALGFAVALQSDGKILVGGSNSSKPGGMVARLTSSGRLDRTFGGVGYVYLPVAPRWRAVQSLLVLSDGRFLVGSDSNTPSGMALLRYLPDGTLDTTFGASGIAAPVGCPTSLVLDPAGDVISCDSRTSPSGVVDTSFAFSTGPGPFVPCNIPPGYSATLQSDGKVVIAGGCGDTFRVYAAPTHVAPYCLSCVAMSDMSLTGPVTVYFTSSVSGVSQSTVVATDQATGAVVPGHLNVSPTTATTTASWTPNAPLVANEQYTLTLTDGIHDASDGLPLHPATVQFTTISAVLAKDMDERWASVADAAASGRSYEASRTANSSMSVSFAGPSISVYGITAPDGGYATVYLDGVSHPASFYSPSIQHHAAIWSASGLSSGAHHLQIVPTGTAPSGATASWVRVDSFQTAASSFEETDPAVLDRFAQVTIPAPYFPDMFDSAQHTIAAGVSPPVFTARVRGTGFRLDGAGTPTSGKAMVSVDGVVVATVDLYAPPSTSAQDVTYQASGLSDSEHVVQVRPVGTPTGTDSDVGIRNLLVTS